MTRALQCSASRSRQCCWAGKSSIVQEPGEGGHPLEHVVHRAADIVLAREFDAGLPHPGFQLFHQRSALLRPSRPSLIWRDGVDVALDGKDRIDPQHCLHRQRRPGQLGELEELAPGMALRCHSTCNARGTLGSFAQHPASAIGPGLRAAA